MLHTKYMSCGPHSFGEEDFLSFSHYKSMGAIYGYGGHLDLQTMTICTYFQSPFNTRIHIKFEEIWPRGFRAEVVQRCEWTDGRTVGRWTESDHNSSSRAFGSGELKKLQKFSKGHNSANNWRTVTSISWSNYISSFSLI